jgi:tRNA 2-thiocytidine biosynthesis protein TtcA
MPTTDLQRCTGRLLGKVRQTARRWPVLPEGERMLLAISGGIDSLAMAYLVGEHARTLKRPPEVSAIHVRLDADRRGAGLSRDIARWLASRELELAEVEGRLDGAEIPPLDDRARARAIRRTLLEAADHRGVRQVALGHHADDVVEIWLTSLMYTGSAETIPPVRSYFDGAVTLVRPLFELWRREIQRLGQLADFPESSAGCRRQGEERRERVREALSVLGRDQKLVRRQLYLAAVRENGESNK